MNNTMQKTLEVEVLNIQKGEYLSKALKRQGYPMLPSNAIINKVMTGTGATYMELHPKLSPRNSIVIEPFKSAVENKVQVFNEALGVFKEHCCPEKFYHSVSCLGPSPSGTLAVRSV